MEESRCARLGVRREPLRGRDVDKDDASCVLSAKFTILLLDRKPYRSKYQ